MSAGLELDLDPDQGHRFNVNTVNHLDMNVSLALDGSLFTSKTGDERIIGGMII